MIALCCLENDHYEAYGSLCKPTHGYLKECWADKGSKLAGRTGSFGGIVARAVAVKSKERRNFYLRSKTRLYQTPLTSNIPRKQSFRNLNRITDALMHAITRF